LRMAEIVPESCGHCKQDNPPLDNDLAEPTQSNYPHKDARSPNIP